MGTYSRCKFYERVAKKRKALQNLIEVAKKIEKALRNLTQGNQGTKKGVHIVATQSTKSALIKYLIGLS
jgi:hypothetical protein